MPILGIIASSMQGDTGLGAYNSIATFTLTSSQPSITFSSIPSTFTHLQLRAMMICTSVNNPKMNFNGNTGANYSWHHLYGDGGGNPTLSNGNGSQSFMYYSYVPNTSSAAFTITDILDYRSTIKNKTMKTFSGSDANGSGEVAIWSGAFYDVNPVTSITLTPSAGNFATYSSFALYGIKGV